MNKLFVAVLLGATAVPVALAATNPWDGTWKLDAAKSHLTGRTFTYAKEANNMWRVTEGPISYEFAVNGQPFKTTDPEDTVIAVDLGSHEVGFISQFKGKVISKTHETLSADDKTLTDQNTNYLPDGSTRQSTVVHERVGRGSGFAGTWKSTQVSRSTAGTYTISSPSTDTIKWEIPAYQESVEGKMDGTPLNITGPTVSPGMTLTVKKISPDKLQYWVKMNGKDLGESTLTVSADGKWLTIDHSTVNQAKTTTVYEKQ